MRRKVFNHGNKKRLLGTLEINRPFIGRMLEMVVEKPISWHSLHHSTHSEETYPYESILFHYDVIEGRMENDGWTRVEDIHLSTDAKLEDLMKIKSFWLPGESESSAEYRRRAARYA
jgi:hypothetical protein